ncbi:MAG TPA: hypothetical protein VMZ71_13205 [Gemmataceae bacterium]|nr:hypothetical protein [Gemmataceae bacterium]
MRCPLVLAVVVGFALPERAAADTYMYSVYSLEWLTDASDVVVLAHTAGARPAGADKTATLKDVEQVLKGKFEKPYPAVANFAGVVAGESRALLFLRRTEKAGLAVHYAVYLNKHAVPAKDRAAYFAGIIPQFHDSSAEPMSFRDTRCVAIDKALNVLSDPDAVVKQVAARAKAKPGAGADGFYTFLGDECLVQTDIVYRVLRPFDPEYRNDFLKQLTAGSGHDRYAAVHHLSRYKDREVVAALKNCLADEFVMELRVDPGRADSPRKRFFAVRKAAYDTLRAWGEDVVRPELDAPPAKP